MAATPDVASGMKASTSFPQQLGDTCDYAGKMAPELQKEFVRLKGLTYLDHAGATLYAESQLRSVFDDLSQSVYGNPHSHNGSGQMTSEAIDQVRFRRMKNLQEDQKL
uniref:Aminotransferase class V domain-containing protein n=1 Tax=Strigamia maritima TaxID=126957 RepID=T1ISR8_STRMM